MSFIIGCCGSICGYGMFMYTCLYGIRMQMIYIKEYPNMTAVSACMITTLMVTLLAMFMFSLYNSMCMYTAMIRRHYDTMVHIDEEQGLINAV